MVVLPQELAGENRSCFLGKPMEFEGSMDRRKFALTYWGSITKSQRYCLIIHSYQMWIIFYACFPNHIASAQRAKEKCQGRIIRFPTETTGKREIVIDIIVAALFQSKVWRQLVTRQSRLKPLLNTDSLWNTAKQSLCWFLHFYIDSSESSCPTTANCFFLFCI